MDLSPLTRKNNLPHPYAPAGDRTPIIVEVLRHNSSIGGCILAVTRPSSSGKQQSCGMSLEILIQIQYQLELEHG
jgi:hypothetical protein